MNKDYGKLLDCLKIVQSKTDMKPKLALVLGSGLGDYAEGIDAETAISYKDIEGFPVSTVPGHSGRFIFGHVGNVPVVIMQGRIHYYEGYDISEVVMPIRLMGMMGAEMIVLTNAVGAINKSFQTGDLMLIRDHIMHSVPSPLIGANLEELGTRFPDMGEVYNREMSEKVKAAAVSLDITLREGVYMQASGPNFETPAEIRAFGLLGADVVGMSTACEAVAAHHMGMRVCGISCISNLAAGISKTPLTHEDVQKMADKVAPEFKKLVTKSIERIGG